MLEPLGVSVLAEQVYRTLLRDGPGPESALATATGTSHEELTGALGELQRLELAFPDGGDPPRWRAVPPDLAVESLVVGEQERLLRRQRELVRAQAALGDLMELARAGPGYADGRLVEVTADPDATGRRCGHLLRTVRRDVAALDRLPYGVAAAAPYDPRHDLAELALLERGVLIRAVYEQAALGVPGRFPVLLRLVEAGERARVLPAVPVKLVIYDREHAVVQLDRVDERATTAVFVHASGLLDALLVLFDLLWERAVPIPAGPGLSLPAAGAEFDEQLLTLLAAGFKDERIARQLGVSPSTVTRRMARLMELAGAATRFQLGVQAARRGWL